MKPKIKLRPIITDNVMLQSALAGVKTSDQMELVVALLHRYGAKKVSDLFPRQVPQFANELKLVLSQQAPDPNDSVLNPTMMEIK